MSEVASDQTTLPSLATAKASNLKYPKSVSVLKTASNSDWFVGDSLLGELGPPSSSGAHDGSKEIFEEIVAEATAVDGHSPLSATALSRRRTVSFNFPPESRRSEYPWAIHDAAGSPDKLEKALASLTECKTAVTRDAVREVLKRLNGQAKEDQRRIRITESERAAREADEAIETIRRTRPDDFDNALKKREKVVARLEKIKLPPPTLKVSLSALSRKADKAAALAADLENDLLGTVQQLSSIERASLEKKFAEVTAAWTACQRVFAPSPA
jgi:hypothetical protein